MVGWEAVLHRAPSSIFYSAEKHKETANLVFHILYIHTYIHLSIQSYSAAEHEGKSVGHNQGLIHQHLVAAVGRERGSLAVLVPQALALLQHEEEGGQRDDRDRHPDHPRPADNRPQRPALHRSTSTDSTVRYRTLVGTVRTPNGRAG